MTARKQRPAFGTKVVAGMSYRDIAAAQGMTKSELQRWVNLGALPEDEFEQRLAAHMVGTRWKRPTAASILAMKTPVPARGRVERALALVRAMTPAEFEEFTAQVSALVGVA